MSNLQIICPIILKNVEYERECLRSEKEHKEEDFSWNDSGGKKRKTLWISINHLDREVCTQNIKRTCYNKEKDWRISWICGKPRNSCINRSSWVWEKCTSVSLCQSKRLQPGKILRDEHLVWWGDLWWEERRLWGEGLLPKGCGWPNIIREEVYRYRKDSQTNPYEFILSAKWAVRLCFNSKISSLCRTHEELRIVAPGWTPNLCGLRTSRVSQDSLNRATVASCRL